MTQHVISVFLGFAAACCMRSSSTEGYDKASAACSAEAAVVSSVETSFLHQMGQNRHSQHQQHRQQQRVLPVLWAVLQARILCTNVPTCERLQSMHSFRGLLAYA
jgi:hypothetical protein